MPVIRSGSFVLYGITLNNPSSLTLGINLSPPDPGRYYVANTTFGGPPAAGVPTPMPCDPGFSAPEFLDTTSDGTGWPAGAPPPGFNLRTRPLFIGPQATAGLPNISGINNDGTWEMAGKTGLDAMDGHGSGVELDDPLLLYIELMEPLRVHYTRIDGFPFSVGFWTEGFVSTPTAGPRIAGQYDIIAWWWLLPTKDKCGNEHESHLVLAEEKPGDNYEKFDPTDSDAAPQPVITNIEPNHGRAGTRVAIIGSGFGDGCNVQFDGVDAVDIDVISQFRVEATAPGPHADGFATVAVINVDGVSS